MMGAEDGGGGEAKPQKGYFPAPRTLSSRNESGLSVLPQPAEPAAVQRRARRGRAGAGAGPGLPGPPGALAPGHAWPRRSRRPLRYAAAFGRGT